MDGVVALLILLSKTASKLRLDAVGGVLLCCLFSSVISGCQTEGEVTGEVFIVTEGRLNIKLALVEIRVIPEAEIKRFLEEKTERSRREREKLEPALLQSKAALEQARESFDMAWAEEEQRLNKYANTGQGLFPHLEAITRAGKLRSKLKVEELEEEFGRLSGEFTYWLSEHFFFEDLPEGILETKTDSEGEFVLILPRLGNFALAASASREVFGKTEEYYWLVWVSLDGEESKRIMLSNDNLFGSGSPDSVITP